MHMTRKVTGSKSRASLTGGAGTDTLDHRVLYSVLADYQRGNRNRREVPHRQQQKAVGLGFAAQGIDHRLEDVHGRVDHNPHYVDEVPVDPGNLHAVVLLGREVAPEGANRRERE